MATFLAGLKADLRQMLGEAAKVEREALTVTWQEVSGALILLTAGHDGGHWEFPWTLESAELVAQIVHSVIAGRVIETFSYRGRGSKSHSSTELL